MSQPGAAANLQGPYVAASKKGVHCEFPRPIVAI
jgi:hypothetical protein